MDKDRPEISNVTYYRGEFDVSVSASGVFMEVTLHNAWMLLDM